MELELELIMAEVAALELKEIGKVLEIHQHLKVNNNLNNKSHDHI